MEVLDLNHKHKLISITYIKQHLYLIELETIMLNGYKQD